MHDYTTLRLLDTVVVPCARENSHLSHSSALLCAPLRSSARFSARSTNICIWCLIMCLIIRWITPRALRHYGLRPRIYICSRPGHYCDCYDCYDVTTLRLLLGNLPTTTTSPTTTPSSSIFIDDYLFVIIAFHCLLSAWRLRGPQRDGNGWRFTPWIFGNNNNSYPRGLLT